VLLNLDFTIDNLEKVRSHEQLVTCIVENCIKALLKFENVVFSRATIILVDDPLIEVALNIFLMSLISYSNALSKLNFSFKIKISLLSSFN